MKRLQRLRSNIHLRNLCAQTEFNSSQLIQPLFIVEGLSQDEDIKGLKGTRRLKRESALKQIELDLEAGVRQFILFNVPQTKASESFNHNFSSQTILEIKKRFGDSLQLWIDTCLCSLTTHGHCCVFHDNGTRNHESTLKEIALTALSYAQAGADGISPSDMMDGRVSAIRKILDEKNFENTPIMSYSTKFSSQFYGPFRNAADSSPKFGDRTQYQIDVRNPRDAMNASLRRAEEGADLLMVKPAMTSLDLIQPISTLTGLGVGAYQVSGEYASLVLLAEAGLVSFEKALLETWHVLKRGGAQYIITYGARLAKELGVKNP
ncbi:MAG: porphobilinogen synthase [Oligoflexia bacterium]|nr:porphobilinogen synthase [Oligoflexia bacterium]